MLVGNVADTDDVMQEISAIMWEKFATYDMQKSFVAWGIGIAKNKILHYKRDHHRNIRDYLSKEILDNIAEYASGHIDQTRHRQDALRQCVEKLKGNDQRLIFLRYENDLPVKKVAELTGRSQVAIYKTFARIHGLLQNCVKSTMTAWGL